MTERRGVTSQAMVFRKGELMGWMPELRKMADSVIFPYTTTTISLPPGEEPELKTRAGIQRPRVWVGCKCWWVPPLSPSEF